jgi:hypothetical protein
VAPDGSRAVRRLPRAADAGICSACLDAHSNCVLAGAPGRLGMGASETAGAPQGMQCTARLYYTTGLWQSSWLQCVSPGYAVTAR